MKTFRDLLVWQEAYKLTLEIYGLTRRFPQTEMFALTNQIQRAVVSITSNIAEGYGRSSIREKDQFYAIARGSLTEVENQIIIAKGLKYISESNYQKVMEQIILTHKLLHGLQKANKERSEN